MKKIKTIKIDLLAELIAFESKIEELSTAMRRKCMMSPGLNTSTYFDRLDLQITGPDNTTYGYDTGEISCNRTHQRTIPPGGSLIDDITLFWNAETNGLTFPQIGTRAAASVRKVPFHARKLRYSVAICVKYQFVNRVKPGSVSEYGPGW